MPRAHARVFEQLLERAREHGFDACLFESRTGPEPLCGAYRRGCLPSVSAALDAGERRVTSFERFATEEGTRPTVGWLRESELEAELRNVECAFNVNTPSDLERARAGSRADSDTTQEQHPTENGR
jgi:molybdopterin-guanine dinucleotide biosynthesis protein A